jgi:hypothetical protein
MNRVGFPLAAALPGIVVMAAALAGAPPTARDLPTYFVPLRHYTAQVLAGRSAPFWNPQVGCGEPYFANPQTGILYPLAWCATFVSADRAVGLEVGFHLALLGAGCCVLARRLGAGRWLAVAAGIGSACAGPIASSAGMLNNLATTAWLPWLWASALSGSVPGVAGAGAAAWLAAEPQLAVLGGLVAVAAAPRRRTVAGLVLAGCVVAVQALPFAFWVAGGDRGPGSAGVATAARSVSPTEILSLALPGVKGAREGHAPFVASLTLPLWCVVLSFAAARDRGTARSRLAIAGWALVVLATMTSLPLGERLWTFVTLGLVRHPGRLLFPATIALVTAAAACQRRLRMGWAAGLCAVIGVIGVAMGADPLATCLAAAGAAAVVGSFAPAAGALIGALALAPAGIDELRLRRVPAAPALACAVQQHPPGRVYVVEPTSAQERWVSRDWPSRAYDLGWGYTPLLDGRRMVRTFGPLGSRRLAEHLAKADRGPGGRWWLNGLGADAIVSHHSIEGFPVLCRENDLVVCENPHAWPEIFLARALPEPDRPVAFGGEVLSTVEGRDAAEWTVRVDAAGGMLVRLATPDPGWRFTVDGRTVAPVTGPGIIHGVPVAEGQHVVRATYRPPGLLIGAGITALGLGMVVGVRWRRW